MDSGQIEKLYADAKAIVDFLEQAKEVSFKNFADDVFKKNLLIAAASYFEEQVKAILLEFTKKESNNSPKLVAFVKNKNIDRQFHALFKWEDPHAN